MDRKELMEKLQQIENVTVLSNNKLVEVKTLLSGYLAKIDSDDVLFTQIVPSPFGQDSLQIFYSDGGGIIVTPNDFVFNVEQDEFVRVDDLPPMCSVREMALGFDKYRRNPNPSKNFDTNLGLFYFHYYIMKSAFSKGFRFEQINKLYDIGLEHGYLLENNETSNLFKELGFEKREIVNHLRQVWNGYCPESHLFGRTVRMRLNSDDFYESEETGLQIVVLSGVQAIILKFRGSGSFRSTVSYADEIENGELLSPQNIDSPPFNSPTEIFTKSEDIENYILKIRK